MTNPAPQTLAPMPAPLLDRVVVILEQARGQVVRAVNTQMVWAYWLIGREIVQALQGGDERAACLGRARKFEPARGQSADEDPAAVQGIADLQDWACPRGIDPELPRRGCRGCGRPEGAGLKGGQDQVQLGAELRPGLVGKIVVDHQDTSSAWMRSLRRRTL